MILYIFSKKITKILIRSKKLKVIILNQKNMKLVTNFSKTVTYPLLLYLNLSYLKIICITTGNQIL